MPPDGVNDKRRVAVVGDSPQANEEWLTTWRYNEDGTLGDGSKPEWTLRNV